MRNPLRAYIERVVQLVFYRELHRTLSHRRDCDHHCIPVFGDSERAEKWSHHVAADRLNEVVRTAAEGARK